jgi:hypothetical protein
MAVPILQKPSIQLLNSLLRSPTPLEPDELGPPCPDTRAFSQIENCTDYYTFGEKILR